MTAIAWQRQQWSSATTIRSSTKRERNPAEEKAPNSRSPTELPGANRSWVAVGDDPEALQQRGWDDVKAEDAPSGPYSECERMSSLVGEMCGQLFDGCQDEGTVVFFQSTQQTRDHLALVMGTIARRRQQFIHPTVENIC